jgi:predicted TPR repeat methyltransferase
VPELGPCSPYFEQVLGGFPGKRILSLGCGDGLIAQELAASGAEVVTVDHRATSAEAFEGHESFDAVIVVGAFEQIEDIADRDDRVTAAPVRRSSLATRANERMDVSRRIDVHPRGDP